MGKKYTEAGGLNDQDHGLLGGDPTSHCSPPSGMDGFNDAEDIIGLNKSSTPTAPTGAKGGLNDDPPGFSQQ